jgi:hypothetical protein
MIKVPVTSIAIAYTAPVYFAKPNPSTCSSLLLIGAIWSRSGAIQALLQQIYESMIVKLKI